MRAGIYLRVSTADQHPENQLADLKAYAERSGWEIVTTAVDRESGTKSAQDREGLREMLARARRKEIDVLLFWSLDRLTREGVRKTLEYLTALDHYGVKWHSYTEEYLSSLGPFSDVVVSILSTLAKQEAQRRSERTRAGLERVRAEGRRLGRPEGTTEATRAKAEQAAKLREEGKSYREIGQILRVSRQRAHQLCSMA